MNGPVSLDVSGDISGALSLPLRTRRVLGPREGYPMEGPMMLRERLRFFFWGRGAKSGWGLPLSFRGIAFWEMGPFLWAARVNL